MVPTTERSVGSIMLRGDPQCPSPLRAWSGRQTKGLYFKQSALVELDLHQAFRDRRCSAPCVGASPLPTPIIAPAHMQQFHLTNFFGDARAADHAVREEGIHGRVVAATVLLPVKARRSYMPVRAQDGNSRAGAVQQIIMALQSDTLNQARKTPEASRGLLLLRANSR